MKQQGQRATQLTLLAAFYLPLTLVTGIFGMNIKEFDDVKPSFKLCFEALFAVIAVTLIFYGLYRFSPSTSQWYELGRYMAHIPEWYRVRRFTTFKLRQYKKYTERRAFDPEEEMVHMARRTLPKQHDPEQEDWYEFA